MGRLCRIEKKVEYEGEEEWAHNEGEDLGRGAENSEGTRVASSLFSPSSSSSSSSSRDDSFGNPIVRLNSSSCCTSGFSRHF